MGFSSVAIEFKITQFARLFLNMCVLIILGTGHKWHSKTGSVITQSLSIFEMWQYPLFPLMSTAQHSAHDDFTSTMLPLISKSCCMSWFIKVPKINGSYDEGPKDLSDSTDIEHDVDGNSVLQPDVGPQPLPIMKARLRKLLSIRDNSRLNSIIALK